VIIPFADYLGSATSFFEISQLCACSSRYTFRRTNFWMRRNYF
jgi:hypothetical protein